MAWCNNLLLCSLARGLGGAHSVSIGYSCNQLGFDTVPSEDAPHYTWESASASSGSTNDDSLSQGSSTVAPRGDFDKEKGYKNGDGSEQFVKGEL